MNYIYRYFSPEAIHRHHVSIPSLDVQRRPKNIAKVEPYSMNNNPTRPLSQARIELNSMGNTPTNSSTSSSSAISLGGSMMRYSDFLLPLSKSSSSYIPSRIPFSDSFVYPTSNGQKNDLPSSISHSQEKYQSSLTKDVHASMVRIIKAKHFLRCFCIEFQLGCVSSSSRSRVRITIDNRFVQR